MKLEYSALFNNNTCNLIDLSYGSINVGCKWVYKNKYNANGPFQRQKAHFVTKGFHQTPGFDYTKTFNPMVKPTTIHIVLGHAISSR